MRELRGGFAFSIGVHALIVLLVLFGLPFLRPKPIELPPMISVEVIDLAKETTTNKISTANKVKKQLDDETPPPPAPPPEAQPEPKPEPQARTEPPPPPPPPEPKPKPVLDAAVPKLAAVDDALPDLQIPKETFRPRLAPAPELAQVDSRIAELTAPAKVDLKRPEPKKPAETMDAVLKNIEKLKPQESAPPQPAPQPPKQATKPPSGAQAPLSANLTASELSALAAQLARCWNLPATAKDAQSLVVDLDVTVNPDRTIAGAPHVVDQARLATDQAYAVAARAAIRALRMPQCTPLMLPPDKYQEWQSMTIHFDPKEMLGQ